MLQAWRSSEEEPERLSDIHPVFNVTNYEEHGASRVRLSLSRAARWELQGNRPLTTLVNKFRGLTN